MKYNFTEVVDRTDMIGSRWQEMYELKGNIPPGTVPISSADMDFELAPEIVDGLKNHINHTVFGYTEPNIAYFDSVVRWMKSKHNWQIDSNWVVPMPGIVAALAVFIQEFSKPGDGVIIMDPVWPMFNEIPQRYSRKVVKNSLIIEDNEYRIDFKNLEKNAAKKENKILLFNNPHNPVGRVWTEKELIKLAQVCEEHNLLVFCDEVHEDLIYPGHTHVKLCEVSDYMRAHTIVATSPSKAFNLSGLCVSNIIISNCDLLERFKKKAEFLVLNKVNAMGLEAGKLAYNKAEPWLNNLLNLININRGLLNEIISSELPKAVVYPLEGTYLQWINLNEYQLSSKKIHEKNIENNVFLTEGDIFGDIGEGFNRINIATSTDKLTETLERYTKGISELI
ncbi:MalY/PatB family protein [Falseniella ignava]|uniref:cysteine-S-conjugate beta-lyase n=1 Tax=Falseniella ignava CCUG 37419 TaxID=883112 RepID=K1LUH4_9LACT|nr:PatB family C-S lyase [Falseniella ignava]EKB55772.1 hypothetical protein HMPREF9707_00959 [Falseniella ignava CCUG 37419]